MRLRSKVPVQELLDHFQVRRAGAAADPRALDGRHGVGKARALVRALALHHGEDIAAVVDVARAERVHDRDLEPGRKRPAVLPGDDGALVAQGEDHDLRPARADRAEVFLVLLALPKELVVVELRADEHVDLGQHGLRRIGVAVAVEADGAAVLPHDGRQPVGDGVGVLQVQHVVLPHKVLVDVLQRVPARRSRPADDVAAVRHLVREDEGKGVDAVADHMAGVDVVACVVAEQELSIAVRADHAQHGRGPAELAKGRQRRGDLAAALPARLQNARALVLFRGQVVDVNEIIHERGSVRDQIPLHGCFTPPEQIRCIFRGTLRASCRSTRRRSSAPLCRRTPAGAPPPQSPGSGAARWTPR